MTIDILICLTFGVSSLATALHRLSLLCLIFKNEKFYKSYLYLLSRVLSLQGEYHISFIPPSGLSVAYLDLFVTLFSF